jgi:membrane protease YdiL (CAAX protease family)
LPLLVVNFGLVAYCVFFFRPRHALPALLGERWHSVRRAAVDCSIALATCVVICGSELAFAHFTHVRRNAAIAALLPSGVAERLTWILVAVCVGFCEEVVYRGYLQTQLSAFSGRAALGIALQGILFGIAHLDQGPAVALRIAAYGCFFGLITRFRRSLLPSITAHIAIDLASGLLR